MNRYDSKTPKPPLSVAQTHTGPGVLMLPGSHYRGQIETIYTRLPRFTSLMWALYCFTMLFSIPLAFAGMTVSTVFSLPVMLFAFSFLSAFYNYSLGYALALLLVGVWGSAALNNDLSSIYVNFTFWVINAYAAYRMLRHPQGREIAITMWAWGTVLLALSRVADLMGVSELHMFDRNGYGFFISIFMAPTYIYFQKRYSQRTANLLLLGLVMVILINASRSSMATGVLVSAALFLIYQGRLTTRPKAMRTFVLVVVASIAFLPLLSRFSPLLAERMVQFEIFVQTGDPLATPARPHILLRENLAMKSYEFFKSSPVSGIGFYRYDQIKSDNAAQRFLDSQGLSNVREHNSFLLWLAETGLLGTIPMIFFLAIVLSKVGQAMRLYSRTNDSYLFIGLCITLAALFQLNFLANITASGTWVMLVTVVALKDGYVEPTDQSEN